MSAGPKISFWEEQLDFGMLILLVSLLFGGFFSVVGIAKLSLGDALPFAMGILFGLCLASLMLLIHTYNKKKRRR